MENYRDLITSLIAWAAAATGLIAVVRSKADKKTDRAIVVIDDARPTGGLLEVDVQNVGGRAALNVLVSDPSGNRSQVRTGLAANGRCTMRLLDVGAVSLALRLEHSDPDGSHTDANFAFSRDAAGVMLPAPWGARGCTCRA